MLRTLMLKRPRVPTSSPLELTPHTGQLGVSVASGGVIATLTASKVRARRRSQKDAFCVGEKLEIAGFHAELPLPLAPPV